MSIEEEYLRALKGYFIVALVVVFAVVGCRRGYVTVDTLPEYPVGTVVKNKLNGLRGIVLNWWCDDTPCLYSVRYAIAHQAGSSSFGGSVWGFRGYSEYGVGLWKEEVSSGYELERYEEVPQLQYLEEVEEDPDDISEWRGE